MLSTRIEQLGHPASRSQRHMKWYTISCRRPSGIETPAPPESHRSSSRSDFVACPCSTYETKQGGAVDELGAKQAITEVLYRYCRAIDRMDRDLASTIWHPGGSADYGPVFKGTGEAF